MNAKFKKLHPSAIIPKYQSKGASGFDFHALEDVAIRPGETVLIQTGLAVEFEEGWELQVRPRSGISLKTPLRIPNSPGTVDVDYRGPLNIIMTNTAPVPVKRFNISGVPHRSDMPAGTQFIKQGDRIAQGVFVPVIQADISEAGELSDTERGSNGFGSSGV